VAFTLFKRRRADATIQALYGAIVAQARHPAFYADYGVPDTVDGRFEMIVLHLALTVRRLRDEPDAIKAQAQGAFDAFCTDMDHNLREMGFSDVGVPRQMRSFGEAFYGRAAAYDRALDGEGAAELTDTLARNVFAGGAAVGAARLGVYVRAAVKGLADQCSQALTQGKLSFPDPQTIIAPG
jgi:cytochrome b pre-mRNA-processing protein 3